MTISPRSHWRRVSHRERCPVCDHPDWCLVVGPTNQPTAAICTRQESARLVGKKGAGWLHRLRADQLDRPRPWLRTKAAIRKTNNINFAELASRYTATVKPEHLAGFAGTMGLSVGSLKRLGIGWKGPSCAWSFPMTDASGQIVGIRLRAASGSKFSERGGREGLFLPSGLETAHLQDCLLVCEGPSDTAAALDSGLPAVGRPSCRGGVELLVDFARQHGVRKIVILADSDEPGQAGAKALADKLAVLPIELSIVTPPAGIKDVREWRRQGATATDVLTAPAVVFPHPAIRRARRHAIQHRRSARS
jgi:hypothetical protein